MAKEMTFKELEERLAKKLMENEITPEEFVNRYNEMLQEENKKHEEPIEPHENI